MKKKCYEFSKEIFDEFKSRMFRCFRFPQYLLFCIELFMELIVFISVSRPGVSNNILISRLLILSFVFVSILLFAIRKNKDFSFRAIVNSDSKDVAFTKYSVTVWVKILFVVFLLVFFINFVIPGLDVNNPIFTLVMFVFFMEMIFFGFKLSPFNLLFIIGGPLFLASQMGIKEGLLTWSVLSFFVITVGLNFFDETFIKQNLNLDISDDNRLEVKIDYICLFSTLLISLLVSECIISMYSYRLFIVYHLPLEWFFNSSLKVIIFLLIYIFYSFSKERIFFLILYYLYRKKLESIDGLYLPVNYDKRNKKWYVSYNVYSLKEDRKKSVIHRELVSGGKEITYDLVDIKRVLSDIIQIKQQYYIKFLSSKISKNKDSQKEIGYSLLGNPIKSDLPFMLLISILILLAIGGNWFSKREININDQYFAVQEVGNQEIINISKRLVIKGYVIRYNGSVESIDKMTFNFDNGGYSIRPSQNRLKIVDNFTQKQQIYVRKDSPEYKKYYREFWLSEFNYEKKMSDAIVKLKQNAHK